MNCEACGANLVENAKFCWKCGATVVRGQTTPGRAPASSELEVAGEPSQFAGATLAPAFDAVRETLRRLVVADVSAFEEIRADVTFTVPALVIAALAVLASGLGGSFWYAVEFEWEGEFFWKSGVLGSLFGFLFWALGTGATFFMLRSALRMDVKPDEVFRVAGFAAIPLAIGLFIFIPEIAFGIGLVSIALFLAFSALAVQRAFDIPAEKALMAVAPGFALWAIVLPLLVSSDNPFGPGIFVFDWCGDVLDDIYNAYVGFR
jgi:hypothetical protein